MSTPLIQIIGSSGLAAMARELIDVPGFIQDPARFELELVNPGGGSLTLKPYIYTIGNKGGPHARRDRINDWVLLGRWDDQTVTNVPWLQPLRIFRADITLDPVRDTCAGDMTPLNYEVLHFLGIDLG